MTVNARFFQYDTILIVNPKLSQNTDRRNCMNGSCVSHVTAQWGSFQFSSVMFHSYGKSLTVYVTMFANEKYREVHELDSSELIP